MAGRVTFPDEKNAGSAVHERARALVLRFGWNTTAYQILNPGFSLWFSGDYPAVVGYVRWSKRRVVAGAPVCAAEHLSHVAAEFEADAMERGERVVYFGAEARLAMIYRDVSSHSGVVLGAQPSWHPAGWPQRIARHASLRAQLNRARGKGVSVVHWPSQIARAHPGLLRCLDEWLATRPLPPLHFLIEPDTLGALRDRRVFVAQRGGCPVGFLVASPIPARRGWLTEQFVRCHGAPNGTTELMIDTAVRWMAAEHAEYVTLGLAPLSTRAGVTALPASGHPFWLRGLFRWTRAHGRRFYNFDGLDAFKAKFDPEQWEPAFAISNERSFSVRSLYAIAAAFTNGAPARTIAAGLGRAIRQEVAWLAERPVGATGG